MTIELFKALTQIFMIVERQIARVRIEREGAERSAEARKLGEQFLGMAALGDEQMAQTAQAPN